MTDPERTPRKKELPKELQPTQAQLRHLLDTILAHEPQVSPFDGLPSQEILDKYEADLSDFEILAGPPRYDETMSPATTLRTPDKRIVWLSVFRNPDSNKVVCQHAMIIDPPINRSERPEVPREDYEITEPETDVYEIDHLNSPPMTRLEVDALQQLIDASIPFNAFLQIEDQR